ncbi:MAG: hypothetical protein Q9218_001445 [Villophora microphyllina]
MQRYLQEKDPYKELLAKPAGTPARDERRKEEQPSNHNTYSGSGEHQHVEVMTELDEGHM